MFCFEMHVPNGATPVRHMQYAVCKPQLIPLQISILHACQCAQGPTSASMQHSTQLEYRTYMHACMHALHGIHDMLHSIDGVNMLYKCVTYLVLML